MFLLQCSECVLANYTHCSSRVHFHLNAFPRLVRPQQHMVQFFVFPNCELCNYSQLFPPPLLLCLNNCQSFPNLASRHPVDFYHVPLVCFDISSLCALSCGTQNTRHPEICIVGDHVYPPISHSPLSVLPVNLFVVVRLQG